MKITISRSFSKKVQLKQFEPIDSFCAAQIEYDLDSPLKKPEVHADEMTEMSQRLDKFCRDEVDKTLAIIRPPLKEEKGKSKAERKEVTKDEAELDAGIDDV